MNIVFFFCQLHITWNLFRTKNLYVVLSKNCTLAATPSTTISYLCYTIRYYTKLYQNYHPTPPCVSLMAMVQLQSWRTLLKLSINLPAILTQFFFLLDKMPFGIQVEIYGLNFAKMYNVLLCRVQYVHYSNANSLYRFLSLVSVALL